MSDPRSPHSVLDAPGAPRRRARAPSAAVLVAAALGLSAGCSQLEPELEGFGCADDADCVAGFACDRVAGVCVGCLDRDGDGYGSGGDCFGSDCDDTLATCSRDCGSADRDAVPDCGDTCLDVDGDGLGDGTRENSGCVIGADDADPTDTQVCADVDVDGCDDCTSAVFNPRGDGIDTDGDGACDVGDRDDDGDGVPDDADTGPLDETICRDVDGDGCDDCAQVRPPNPGADGADFDADGSCDRGDPDDDDDGVLDGADVAPRDPTHCADADADGCDDCVRTLGPGDPLDDGDDHDLDGLCDAGDPDDDGDQVLDGADAQPFERSRCGDSDGDGCDDCAVTFGPPSAGDDGPDNDLDGRCDAGDPDDDDDEVPDVADGAPFDGLRCRDADEDGCDDCSVTAGPPDPFNDGADGDLDRICDLSDPCTDGDGDGLGTGTLGNVACSGTAVDLDDADVTRCADTDGDGCDDCSDGSWDPGADGSDGDEDGQCDSGDDCTDGDADGVGRVALGRSACIVGGPDSDDDDPNVCLDVDGDGCDDCGAGTWSSSADGPDADGDGLCDGGDDCTDEDGDGVGDGILGNAGCVTTVTDRDDNDRFGCADTDGDGCEDCTTGDWDPGLDGLDLDNDGVCDGGDTCTDVDGDGLGRAGSPRDTCADPSADANDSDRFACADVDGDTCDDCDSGVWDPSLDGRDSDGDGICDRSSWLSLDWGYRRAIEIAPSGVSGDLSSFPISITAVEPALAVARADGADLVFTGADGVTVLDYELERWEQSSGTLAAWVRMDTLSSVEPTVIYLYYGHPLAADQQDPTAIWDTEHRGVWHLAEDPASPGGILDSTGYDNDGVAAASMTSGDRVPSPRGEALDFSVASAGVDVGSPGSLGDLSAYTIEAWIQPRSLPVGCAHVFSKATAGGDEHVLDVCDDGSILVRRARDPAAELTCRSDAGRVAVGSWLHVVAVVDLTDLAAPMAELWLDGTPACTSFSPGSGAPVSDAGLPVILGNGAGGDRAFDGLIDEVRYSATVRSSDWIRTSFNNQSASASFALFGPEETAP